MTFVTALSLHIYTSYVTKKVFKDFQQKEKRKKEEGFLKMTLKSLLITISPPFSLVTKHELLSQCYGNH